MNEHQVIYFPIHSISELITNSSSETYICATDATIKVAKEIVDSILKLNGIDKAVDDLFFVEVGYCINLKGFEREARSVKIEYDKEDSTETLVTKTQLDSLKSILTDDELVDFYDPSDDDYYNSYLIITRKNKNIDLDENLLNAVMKISKLFSTYEIKSS